MNIRVQPTPKADPTPQEDPWYYGWRYVEQVGADGQVEMVQVPLTEEDVLHPQEYDFIVQNDDHTTDCHYLKTILDAHLANRPGVHVFHDHRMDWGVEGIEPHGPDFAVVEGFPDNWDGRRGTFCLAEFAARTLLVIEVTSPTTRKGDLKEKVLEYYQAGIPYYAIVDRQFQKATQPRLFTYRAGERGYELVEPDAEGWLALEPIGLALAFAGNDLVCRDAEGRRLLNYQEMMQAYQATKTRTDTETRTRLMFETRADAEARKRQMAEALADAQRRRAEEAEALADVQRARAETAEALADVQRARVDDAKTLADVQRARAETAEERIRQLEVEMNRLRGQP